MSPMMGASLSRDGEWVQVIAHEASILRAKTSGRLLENLWKLIDQPVLLLSANINCIYKFSLHQLRLK